MSEPDLTQLHKESVRIEARDSDHELSCAKQSLLELPGVVGIGNDASGSLVVYVDRARFEESIPKSIEGQPTRVEYTGPIHLR